MYIWYKPALFLSCYAILVKTTTVLYHNGLQTTEVTSALPTCFSSDVPVFPSQSPGYPYVNVCPLSTQPSPNCQTWLVISMIMLKKDANSNSNLQKIQNFINTVTADCDSQSFMQLYAPGSDTSKCPKAYAIGSLDQSKLVNSILPSVTYVPDHTNAGDVLLYMFDNVTFCSNQDASSSSMGKVIFLFTNIPCDDLCESQQLHQNISTTLLKLTKSFIIRIMYLSDGTYSGAGKLQGCLNSVFPYCAAVQNLPNAVCSVQAYGPYGEANETMSSCAPQMKTCYPNQYPDGKHLTETELILTIVIPCAAFTGLCVVIAYLCCRRARLLNNKWKNFFKMAGEQDPDCTLEQAFPKAKENHYTHLQVLAEKNLKDNWEVPLKNLDVKENVLGSGAFSTVYKGIITGRVPLFDIYASTKVTVESQLENGCETAVKRLPPHADDQSRLDFFHEIDFMKNLGYHAHIISMLGCVSNPWDPLILVEYCHYGDLLGFLRSQRAHVLQTDEEDCPIDVDVCVRIKDLVSIAWQISDGMTYLSSKQFIHRDLAARNVLITKNLVAKVADFGLCRYIDSALYSAKGGRLPIKWMALESLKFYEYSMKSDVWSFAILLFEVFSLGDGPFQAIQPLEMVDYLEEGNRLPKPKTCPDEIYSLMERCWKASPDQRPTFTEVRSALTVLLNSNDENYGYVSLENSNQTERFYETVPEGDSYNQIEKSTKEGREAISSDENQIEDISTKTEKKQKEENFTDSSSSEEVQPSDKAEHEYASVCSDTDDNSEKDMTMQEKLEVNIEANSEEHRKDDHSSNISESETSASESENGEESISNLSKFDEIDRKQSAHAFQAQQDCASDYMKDKCINGDTSVDDWYSKKLTSTRTPR